jgi:hypothetical protein
VSEVILASDVRFSASYALLVQRVDALWLLLSLSTALVLRD